MDKQESNVEACIDMNFLGGNGRMKTKTGYDAVLFDLDGTLTDPKIGITKSVQHALAKYGIIESNLDDLEKFIGPPLIDSFREFYSFSRAEALQAVEYYREYFSVKGIFENFVYPGIPGLLKQLQKKGRNSIVATSKPTEFAMRILEHFGLGRFFCGVVGSNLDGSRTSKIEIIGYTLKEYGLAAKGTVMVGDRMHDIIGARGNGVESIGVTYGYGSPYEIERAGPTHIVSSVSELEMLLLAEETGI